MKVIAGPYGFYGFIPYYMGPRRNTKEEAAEDALRALHFFEIAHFSGLQALP